MIVTIPTMLPRSDKIRQHAPEIYGNELVTYRSVYTQKTEGMPQILLVEQPEPNSTLLPHYHASDQFQLFVEGSGRLGAHPITPVSIHYTNRYTGYGPIVAGESGVSYYVLRPSFDILGPGQYLFRPELREKVKSHRGRKRTLVADGVRIRDVDGLRTLARPEVARLFAVEANEPDAGILAETVCLGPDMPFVGPDLSTGGGQVYFVLQGSAMERGEDLGPRSVIAVTKEGPSVTISAGPNGLQMLVMQYPRWS